MQREEEFWPILPTKEERAVDELSSIHLVQPLRQEQVMRVLDQLFPLVERT